MNSSKLGEHKKPHTIWIDIRFVFTARFLTFFITFAKHNFFPILSEWAMYATHS